MANGHCRCSETVHEPRFIVVTGGPGAGKTALLEVVRRNFCDHVSVLPEAASILFGGGFPRRSEPPARRAAQRAIFQVERELERLAAEERHSGLVLCDRGTLDGLAYWPGPGDEFLGELGTTLEKELSRYALVIHLRTPDASNGYHKNPVRIESAREAAALDQKILECWGAHPRRIIIDSTQDFMEKVSKALAVLRPELPPCCAAKKR